LVAASLAGMGGAAHAATWSPWVDDPPLQEAPPLEESPWFDDVDDVPWFDEAPPLEPDVADDDDLPRHEAVEDDRSGPDVLDRPDVFDDDDNDDAADSRPRVHLSIDVSGNRSVDLVDWGLGGAGHRVVCDSPCERLVSLDPRAEYVVTGSAVRQSRPFTIPERDRVTVRVRRGSPGMFIGGFAVSTLGVSVMAVAPMMFMAAARANLEEPGSGTSSRVAGFALLGAGAFGIIAGVVMVLRSRTRVTID
jgi:hypothetical protein